MRPVRKNGEREVDVVAMIQIKHSGNFNKTENFLNRMKNFNIQQILRKYGEKGVEALAAATPVRSGETASAWGYEILGGNGSYQIVWTNSNINQGYPIALLIQYGHGTGTGGYVQGIDYINPALRPIFEQLASDAWKEVTRV